MTETEKYTILLKELGELIAKKNDTISSQEWEIKYIREQLKDAEAEIERLKGEHNGNAL